MTYGLIEEVIRFEATDKYVSVFTLDTAIEKRSEKKPRQQNLHP